MTSGPFDKGEITRTPGTETAVLAGGCFWGMEDLIRRQPGRARHARRLHRRQNDHATYRNHPGHAEAVEIVFDPSKTTYRDILAFFFQIHDPSTLNRQGNDIGTSYRSAIFPLDARAGAGRPRHDRRRRRVGPVAQEGRDHDRARGPVLGGRARAPGLPRAHPARLHVPLRAPGLGAAQARRDRLGRERRERPDPEGSGRFVVARRLEVLSAGACQSTPRRLGAWGGYSVRANGSKSTGSGPIALDRALDRHELPRSTDSSIESSVSSTW